MNFTSNRGDRSKFSENFASDVGMFESQSSNSASNFELTESLPFLMPNQSPNLPSSAKREHENDVAKKKGEPDTSPPRKKLRKRSSQAKMAVKGPRRSISNVEIVDWRQSTLLNPQAFNNGYDDFGNSGARMMQGGGGGMMMQNLQSDNMIIKNAIATLEKDRDNLRTAIRKLKVDNSRMKIKMKKMVDVLKKGGLAASADIDMDSETKHTMEELEGDDDEYSEIGDFILIGGPNDPFSLRYEVPVKDTAGLEHKSAERYLWYKMAETFGDSESAEKIRTAASGVHAEQHMQQIKNFDENAWNQVKLKHWEDGQRLKFDQVRWIQSLLVYTDQVYIAVASQDKTWGTGWRKQRAESAQPRMWDGENAGGKLLMRLRDHYKTAHAWMGPYEEQETEKKFNELKKSFWRRDLGNRRNKVGGIIRAVGGVRMTTPGGRGRGRGRGGARRAK